MKEIDWFARNLGEALNTLDQAITIVDKAGRFVYYNRASARMDGQDADKILGRHVLEINPWLTEEDSTLLRCIRDGVRFVDSYQAYSGTGGEKLHYLHSAIPLYGQKGDLIGAIEIGKMLTAAPAHLGHHAAPPDIVGEHPALLAQITAVDRFARSMLPVLIQGETGTGKELVARCLHEASPRRKGNYVAINCGGLPDTLFESEIFGHEAGAYTGAAQARGGAAQRRHAGAAVGAQRPGQQTRPGDTVGEPAEQRPLAHLGLRDEGSGPGGVDDEDVQPRHVVGHQQAARRDVGFVGVQADAEDVQQPDRPALPETEMPGRRDEGQDRQCGDQAAQNMEGEAGIAADAHQARGGVGGFQSLRPKKCLA